MALSTHFLNYPVGMRKKDETPDAVSLEDLAAQADDAYVFTDHEDENE